MTVTNQQRSGAIDPRALWETRLQLHWAAQPAAGVGRSLLPPEPDSSQESFGWSDDGTLRQQLIAAPRPFRSALRIHDLTLLLSSEQGVIDQFALDGHTLSDGYAFYESRCASLLVAPVSIARPPAGMPHHAVAEGAPFRANRAELAELGRHYSLANELLIDVQATEPGASAIRCWPHHFDLATLITLAGSGEAARTIGVGMSPGDDGCREPYFYVTPWPYSDTETLPALRHGHWNRRDWTGAMLPASEFATLDADTQRATISSFLFDAIAAARTILECSDRIRS